MVLPADTVSGVYGVMKTFVACATQNLLIVVESNIHVVETRESELRDMDHGGSRHGFRVAG